MSRAFGTLNTSAWQRMRVPLYQGALTTARISAKKPTQACPSATIGGSVPARCMQCSKPTLCPTPNV